MKLFDIGEVEENLANTPSEHLIRLIYISDICTTDDSVFEHIQRHSAIFNKSKGITGFLCNDAKSFLQYLEGRKEVVLALMSRIFKDINHKNVRVILTKPVSGHIFKDWRMRSLNLNSSSWKPPSQHTEIREFIPFEPRTWQPWFIETFITLMKRFDNKDADHSASPFVFDSIGVRELELKLSSDGLLFWLFMGTMASTYLVLLLFNYDVIYS